MRMVVMTRRAEGEEAAVFAPRLRQRPNGFGREECRSLRRARTTSEVPGKNGWEKEQMAGEEKWEK